ncbi:hypothetical protein PC129_g3240 [Phytophthora cactorum]|uniref:Uncharacterized protein n=1 Tax=Phytophthora cactorum TaxID=29920 RepID=A0A8T0ZUM0_9STRA|nr:hypothetical protein Pcac1_g23878 [Phytophthora cactorum]KAG2847085.1 hypothetical protein PC111_g949 [Phytophthora cactorum]KAG2847889.1 hypothetical protein PC112_g935 [Phytophthora cactorum]KAG2867103.1 hypothetical protein PC113_g2237 [Phytophthora cactorum]KAG2933468.1 hypothetical protein PC114_g1461 [Phytophthora cactorum]
MCRIVPERALRAVAILGSFVQQEKLPEMQHSALLPAQTAASRNKMPGGGACEVYAPTPVVGNEKFD